jgi:hypothetical protein
MTPAQKLADAQTKLHQLLTQGGVVTITNENGESITYSKVNAADLEAYVARLEALAAGRRTRGAISLRF